MKHHHPHPAESNSTSTEAVHGPTPPTDRRALLAGIGGLAAGAFIAGKANAGPLNPPPGPISPTGLTLEQLATRTSLPNGIAEPRRPLPDPATNFNITQPGSYYLTRDTDPLGIEIFASDVTLDLCGYTVKGGNNIGVIAIQAGCERVLIRNGRLDGRPNLNSRGVSCEVDAQVTLEDLQIVGGVAGTVSGGVVVFAGRAVCRRVSVTGFQGGITIPLGVVEDCQVEVPGGIQIFGGFSVIRRCLVLSAGAGTAAVNLAEGAIIDTQVTNSGSNTSIRVGFGALIDQCVVLGGHPGISAANNCSVLRTVVRGAQGVGILLGSFSHVADCNVSVSVAVAGGDPGIGVRGTNRLRLERSIIAGNAAQGVRCTGFDAAISDCSIVDNSGVGIDCLGPATIDRCHLHNNNGGMFFDALTRVSQCHLDFNGPYGIWATSPTIGGTFINDCDITRHANGVDIRSATGSGVFRSRFAGNTNADILAPAGNFQLLVFGPAAANAATNPNVSISL